MKDFIIEKLRRSWVNSKRAHAYWLKTKDGWIRLIIAIILLGIFSSALLQDDFKLGASFLFSGIMAIYSGAIYRDVRVMGVIVIGVLVGSVVPNIFSDAWKYVRFGDWISAIILVSFGIFLWYWSSIMKRGRIK